MKGHTNVQIVLFTTPIPKAMFWRKDFHSSQNLAPNIHHAKGLSQCLASLTFARFTCRQCSMQRSWLSKAFFNFDCFNVHIRLFHSTGWRVVSSFLFSKAGEEKELKGWWAFNIIKLGPCGQNFGLKKKDAFAIERVHYLLNDKFF